MIYSRLYYDRTNISRTVKRMDSAFYVLFWVIKALDQSFTIRDMVLTI